MYTYNIGMFGGKFIPFHKGHDYCLSKASKECAKVYCIMFINGADESNIYLSDSQWKMRMQTFIDHTRKYSNVISAVINVADCRFADGTEDWDAETIHVREVVGKRLDAVYSSEPAYGEYFGRAYPEAVHILVDPNREKYPISGTLIRSEWNKGRDWTKYL